MNSSLAITNYLPIPLKTALLLGAHIEVKPSKKDVWSNILDWIAIDHITAEFRVASHDKIIGDKAIELCLSLYQEYTYNDAVHYIPLNSLAPGNILSLSSGFFTTLLVKDDLTVESIPMDKISEMIKNNSLHTYQGYYFKDFEGYIRNSK